MERDPNKLYCDDPSLTQQCFKDECDINLIMKRFKDTMGADYLSQMHGYSGGHFGDFSEIPDYRSALEQVKQAKAMFDNLPAIVRKRFKNDTAEFLDFVQDPRNEPELIQMGLAQPRENTPIDNNPAK